MTIADAVWDAVSSHSDEFTCYSAAVATWSATADEAWPRMVDQGLTLTITEHGPGLLGFSYFRPTLRAELGLKRLGADVPDEATAGIRTELARSGRVIVAGDGFYLPWHVAWGRVHAPHWYVLYDAAHGFEIADPFACRNELGVQQATRREVNDSELPELLRALPGDDPVHELRERLALGDDTTEACQYRHQWMVQAEVASLCEPDGFHGPDAALRLAQHFRQHGQDPGAYAQADDIWSIARHRAFMTRQAQEHSAGNAEPALASWVAEHAEPVARKWGHIAPLLMQASLTLKAGRAASSSVPDTLEQLASMEAAASSTYPQK